jgi:hypothetical protein
MSPPGSGRSIPLPILAVLPVSPVYSPSAVSFPSMPTPLRRARLRRCAAWRA